MFIRASPLVARCSRDSWHKPSTYRFPRPPRDSSAPRFNRTVAHLKVPAQIQAPTSRYNLVIIPPRFPCLLPHPHRLATKGSHRRQEGISSSSGGGGKYEPFSSFLKKDSTEALIDKSWERSYTSKEEAC
ncbi:uncharacterized [Tachysurus ichikawai]